MTARERAEQLHNDFRTRTIKNQRPDIVDMLTEAFIDMQGEKVPPCAEHPKYTGKRKPRSNCEDCWRYFLWKKDNEQF